MWKLISIALVAALLGSAALVGAADAAAPGDWLYGLDRGLESLQTRLAFDAVSQAQLNLQFAQERLAEVQELTRRGDQAHLQQSLVESGLALQSLTRSAGQVENGLDALEVIDEVDAAFAGTAAGDDLDGDDPSDSPHCNGTADKPHPVAAKLAERFAVPYETIIGWFCAGYGFGEIDLAYQISAQSGIAVADLFAQAEQGLGWGEIMQTAGIIKGNGKGAGPDDQDGEEDGDKTNSPACSGEKVQPHAEDLALELAVPYNDIIAWFCQGFGFGEIKLAYTISQGAGVPVAEVFAQKQSGLGWGEILQAYNLKGNPGKGPKEDKGKPADTPGNGPENKGNSKKDK